MENKFKTIILDAPNNAVFIKIPDLFSGKLDELKSVEYSPTTNEILFNQGLASHKSISVGKYFSSNYHYKITSQGHSA